MYSKGISDEQAFGIHERDDREGEKAREAKEIPTCSWLTGETRILWNFHNSSRQGGREAEEERETEVKRTDV